MGLFHSPGIGTENLECVVDAENPKGLIDLISQSTITVYGNTTTTSYGGATAWNFSGDSPPSSSSKSFRINEVPNSGAAGSPSGEAPWSCEVWVYPTSATSQNIIHLSSNNSSTGWCLPCIQMSNGNRFAGHLWQNGPQYVYSEVKTANQWYNVHVTWDATNAFRIFVNGELEGTNTGFTLQTSSGYYGGSGNNYMWIGGPIQTGCSGNQGRNFTGGIAYFAFRYRVMSESEIKKNYQALKGRFGL